MTTEQAPTTEQTRQAWDAIAGRFDDITTPLATTLAQEVLRQIDPKPGTQLLDVAAGSGALSLPAARAGADVVATDLAPTMIERLNQRAHAENLTTLEGRVMDGAALDLEDDAFDVAVSINGVSLFPDIAKGLAEMTRVTRRGGRVVLVGFGPLPQVEFLTFFMGAMKAADDGFTPLPTDPPPLPFQVADPEVLRGRLRDAGLHDPTVQTTTWRMAIDSAEHLWNVITSSNPLGAQLVSGLSDEQATEVRQVLGGMLRERSAGGQGAVLTAPVNIGIGTV